MRKDMCENFGQILDEYEITQSECQQFNKGSLTQGMHTATIRYFETLWKLLI